MERLTIKTEKGAALKMADNYESESEVKQDLMKRYLVAVNRLAAYEDAMPVERAQELSQAEKDGRLVVLPCSLHQPLYILKNGEIHRNYGCQWHFTDKESQTFGTLSLYGEFVGLDDFGKTVFLSKKEAEAALKKREESL